MESRLRLCEGGYQLDWGCVSGCRLVDVLVSDGQCLIYGVRAAAEGREGVKSLYAPYQVIFLPVPREETPKNQEG